MIHYREAQQMVTERARSFGTEQIGLEEAYGRILAEPVAADRDYPPFNRSTMDGYALRLADLEKGIRAFRVVETVYAGAAATRPSGEGDCYKIMTGAPVPAGMDRVIRREEVREGEGYMTLNLYESPSHSNIAGKGEDMRKGDPVIGGPVVCTPSIIGLLASLGKIALLVQTLPRVALITTGNEVVPADVPPGDTQIRNSNRWLLQSLLKGQGLDIALYQHAPDDPVLLKESIRSALAPARESEIEPVRKSAITPVREHPLAPVCDLLILCGGVSAGDADYVPSVLEELGVKKLFHKMAIKPGKPTWCGVTSSGTMVFALPGNPFSCLVNFILLIQPYLQACFGLEATVPTGLPLGALKKKKTPLDEFFPVCLQGSPGRLRPVPLNGSGDIRLGMAAQGLALHPAESGDLAEEACVLYYPF